MPTDLIFESMLLILGGSITDLFSLIEENLGLVDVRFLGNGDIFNDLDMFQVNAKIFDQENNSYGNERILKFFMRKIETLKSELEKTWNSNLSKPITPTKDYIYKKIETIENPRSPITCEFCPGKPVKLKSKKGYKTHCIKFHREETPDMSKIPDDPEVRCLLNKENGIQCKKSYNSDQIYR